MGELSSALELFDPRLRAWFSERVGRPTDIQERAWPAIARGEHLLVAAPTGSGKTLTAFLWALDRLLSGTWERGAVQVLYVSPLKALNTDVRRNLERPLAELGAYFAAEGPGPGLPPIRVMTRSGDTPENERRLMLRHPPEILITTPESLNVLLTSKTGRALLGEVRAVILDEIHAVAGTKRGTHLITAVERVAQLAGEFQRIALSATVEPLAAVAEFVGGSTLEYRGGEAVYQPRRVTLARSTTPKIYDLHVRFPGQAGQELDDDSLWNLLVRDFRQEIRRHRSTLLFANSRRTTEKVTRLINQGQDQDLAYSHHGSLSREVRSVVEERLKAGLLPAIVATNSLELGIDIGDLDQVILIQSPRSFASAIQRIGRAGHGVGQVSRAILYPTHGRDFLDAAVVARAVREQRVEALRIPVGPLDVLAQVVLSMCCGETWALDELYDVIRCAAPYRQLKRAHFELVLEMLAGRYADSRIRELRPRLLVDRVRGTALARAGSDRLLYLAGGTIFDRGYFALRHQQTGAKIGELDEEFVWERSVGDAFTLGNQSWQVQQITHNDVLVLPSRGAAAALAAFWRADSEDRGFLLCQAIAEFLDGCAADLRDDRLVDQWVAEAAFETAAARALLLFLREQAAATGGLLPGKKRLLVERCRDLTADSEHERVILHTLWGGTVNRPLGLALAAAWEERYGEAPELVHDDYCLMIRLPKGTAIADLFALLPAARVEEFLRRRLEQTGFFGARFRLNAATALLLPKAGFKQRMPLWLSRQKAKQLHEQVANYGDFPIVLETWRHCLQDDMAVAELKECLERVREGELPWVEVATTKPSPLAGGIVWQQTSRLMYEDDQANPHGSLASGQYPNSLRADLLQELVFADHLRPRIPASLNEKLRLKVQRLAPGYGPRSREELQLLLEERVLLCDAEWRELGAALRRDQSQDERAEIEVEGLVLGLRLPGASETVWAAPRNVARLCQALELDPASLATAAASFAAKNPAELWQEVAHHQQALGRLGRGDEESPAVLLALSTLVGEWLRGQAIVAPAFVQAIWGLDAPTLHEVLATLREQRWVVVDRLLGSGEHFGEHSGEQVEICDARHLEVLLRWLRQARRPEFRALPIERLPLFIASQQGLLEPGHDLEALQDRLERLFALPLSAGLWEREVLPARLEPYYSAWLDAALRDSDLCWRGCGREKLCFLFTSDLELLPDAGELTPEDAAAWQRLFPAEGAGRDFAELATAARASWPEMNELLWRLAWAGAITHEFFVPVRKGLQENFAPPALPSTARRLPRRGAGWQVTRQAPGRWRRLAPASEELDALDREERIKDRVRLVLQRWGLLCRELLQRELPSLQWSRLFRTLRIMELSGELLAGHFFSGIKGLQFIDPLALRRLEAGIAEDVVFWLNAADPASLCGVEIEGLKNVLPSRQSSTHLVYHGATLVLVSKRRGRELEFAVAADHPRLPDYAGLFRHLLGREVDRMASIQIETINGEPAGSSPYLRRLEALFRVTREGALARLWPSYGV